MFLLAKCGCASSTVCPCVLTAGSNITISGTGQAGDPWIINAGTNPVTVTDTPTVDLTLVGQNISAAVNLEPTGNLITTTAQGLLVSCASILTCLTAGDGIDAAMLTAGTVAACLSTDANNALVFGTDGCLYAPVVNAGMGSVAPLDTNSVDMVVTGGPAFVVSANVKRDPEAGNILTIGASGLDVNLTTGCGLSGDGTAGSPLIVDTNGAVWPWACTEPTNGGKVYCHVGTGGLVVDPEKFVLVEHLIQALVGGAAGTAQPLEDFISPADGGTGTLHSFPVDNTLHPLGVTGDLVITNPSPCRQMQLEVEFGLSHYLLRIDGPGRTNVHVTAALSAAGGGGVAFGTQIGNAHNQNFSNNLAGFTGGNSMDLLWDTGTTYPLNLAPASLVLAPGGSVTFTITGQMKVPNFAANGENSGLTAEAFVRVFGWSL